MLPDLNKSPEYPVGWHVKVIGFIIVRIRHVNVTRPEHSLINEGDDIAGPVLVVVIEVGRQEWAGEQDGPSHGSSIQLVAVGRNYHTHSLCPPAALPPTSKTQHSVHTVP